MAEPGWIIAGWGNWRLLKKRFEAADTVLFVNFSILVHYWWAAKRQFKALLKRDHGWPPEGCPAFPITDQLFKLIWKIHKEMRPQMLKLIGKYARNTRVVHLQSPRKMRIFLRNLEVGD